MRLKISTASDSRPAGLLRAALLTGAVLALLVSTLPHVHVNAAEDSGCYLCHQAPEKMSAPALAAPQAPALPVAADGFEVLPGSAGGLRTPPSRAPPSDS